MTSTVEAVVGTSPVIATILPEAISDTVLDHSELTISTDSETIVLAEATGAYHILDRLDPAGHSTGLFP